jgi:hypothetical protein
MFSYIWSITLKCTIVILYRIDLGQSQSRRRRCIGGALLSPLSLGSKGRYWCLHICSTVCRVCIHKLQTDLAFLNVEGSAIDFDNIRNEEDSQTFDCRVSPLVGAAAHESNVWVLFDKERKEENKLQIIWF